MLKVLSVQQVYAAEKRAIMSGLSGMQLMENAGQLIFEEIARRYPEGRIIVLCGPGNNGGDGYVIARLLKAVGREVLVYKIQDQGAIKGDAEQAFEDIHLTVEDASMLLHGSLDGKHEIRSGDVIVDAVFGVGLNRPLEAEVKDLVEFINSTGAQIVSVDLPSGSNGDATFIPKTSVRADVTVTFSALKAAHVLFPFAEQCGEVVVGEIGLSKFFGDNLPKVFVNSPEVWGEALCWPDGLSHKHSRGRLGIVAGPKSATGAARLSAIAGARTGAGHTTLLGRSDVMQELAAHCASVMTKPYESVEELINLTDRMNAIVVGPGLGLTEVNRLEILSLLKRRSPIVLDADAISLFADGPGELVSHLHSKCVLTPHQQEFERLYPGLFKSADNKIEAALQAARMSNAVVVLKGADTVIASPDGLVSVNVHASPFLATAGSGDVLSGIIAGWLAQGLKPFDAACAAVWIHGDASLLGGAGLIAEDLAEYLPQVLTKLYDRFSSRKIRWERKFHYRS